MEEPPFVSVAVVEMRFPGMAEPLIQDLGVNVRRGELVTIIGPSGAGKTTLLRMIGGLESRYQGSITLKGLRITSPRRHVQFVFQDNRLLPWKTALDNVRFAHPRPNSNEAKIEASRLLGHFEIANRALAWPKTLSGGEPSQV